MTLLTLVIIGMNMGCEDRIDSPVVNTSEGKMVDVSLTIGLDDVTDGASLYPHADTKAGATEAFSAQLVPSVRTKANECPDKLYYLDIHQYKTDGTHLLSHTIGTTNIGNTLDVTLNDNDGAESQLLIIARGATQAVASLSNKSLTEVRQVLAEADILKTVETNGTNISNMPYLLYLPKVKVADGKLQSPNGTDVRLRLKRLATKLTLSWNVGTDFAKNYTLKEVRLFQVPADYRILPEPEDTKWGEVYPNSVSEFVDGYRLKGADLTAASGTKTIWMPANAQGSSSAIVYPNLRSKRYVNPATTYAEFVVDNNSKKERFYYRVYLGGNTTTDFNLLENTDYNWTVNINNVKYTTDDRISMLDQTQVISTNLQPTANCFMMQPGTNICFNPYKHEAGTNGWNTYLTNQNGSINTDKEITKIKVLWQTKDAGTSGDLVLGYIVDDINHQNLVNLTDGSNVNDARIHVKVPNTNGGNAVIAAYNDETIVWSWHIWISDYVPVTLTGDITEVNRSAAIEAAQKATRNGMVHVYGGISWTDPNGSFYKCVIMDRNLGATKGGLQNNAIDWVRSFGLLYQGGRKDPIFGTPDGGTNEARTIYDGNGSALSLDKSSVRVKPTIDQTIQNPLKFYSTPVNQWNGDAAKTIYDPCPKGWRVPSNEYLNNGASGGLQATMGYQVGDSKASLCAGFARTENYYVSEWDKSEKNSDNLMYYDGSDFITLMGKGYGNLGESGTSQLTGSKGAGYLYFGGSGENKDHWTNRSAFFPTAVLRQSGTGNFRPNSNNKLFLWTSTTNVKSKTMQMYEFQSAMLSFQHGNEGGYGFSVRCIQDNIKDRSYSDYQSGK